MSGNTDLIAMLGNLSRSLFPVQSVIVGIAYMLGILFFITALQKLLKIGDQRANSSSQESIYVPIAYILGGAALLFLPSALDALSNTTFGIGNVLSYTDYDHNSIFGSMGLIIRIAGLIWFVRGAVLLSHASNPGSQGQDGLKGFMFLFAGILAVNFDNTVSVIATIFGKIAAFTLNYTST
ncbi:type IV secretion protein IcmC [Legionella sp. CNM-1927-20]|uniref:type IV secretion protein IcmC n=1 Tax=Legionella sp. CNM-1927-20 TaxID=3422221 RepID=UPI00403ACE9B